MLSIEHITQHFYTRFQQEHTIFANFIEGMPSLMEREWYASLMLNRLMFIYFIQKKGFLDKNVNYLNDKMSTIQARIGKDKFLSFYRRLLLRLFHEGSSLQKSQLAHDLDTLLGDVPFLNGGLMEVHEMEHGYSHVHIPDEAFSKIFAFFDAYHWHIDNRPLQCDGEINPDVIGYIFEKYINQKQMGAYYTAEDITTYISKHTIMPYILNTIQQICSMTFAANGSFWCHFQAHLDRYLPAAMLNEDYLPVETEREYRCRKARREQIYAELATRANIDYRDFITYNLDAQRFVRDIILQCADSRLLRACYETIAQMTILDPTCGSGAFLFAALNVLEPLYRVCLERMQNLLENNKHNNQNGQRDERLYEEDRDYFQALLNQIERYGNRAYFVLKSIVTNNLYGVDIMREAVEICKLRLFLRLAALLKDRNEIGLLPDIDFNIRHGNTLVGFTSYREIQRTIVDITSAGTDNEFSLANLVKPSQDEVDKLDAMNDGPHKWIAEFEREISLACPHQSVEQSHRHDQSVPAAIVEGHDKQRQRKWLALRLDRYLAGTYGIDRRHIPAKRSYVQQLRQWRLSHQPFHWFIEFYGVMQRGGFDVIIGNPPYVEYSKVCQEYKVPGYKNKSYGNLYAVILERSLQLVRPGQGHLGLIVPLSICGSGRFKELRQTIKQHIETCWLANFEIFPCGLFSGPNQRLSILLARLGPNTFDLSSALGNLKDPTLPPKPPLAPTECALDNLKGPTQPLKPPLAPTEPDLGNLKGPTLPPRPLLAPTERTGLALKSDGLRLGPTATPTFNVTGKQRWYAQERPHLLDLIAYTRAECGTSTEGIPKLASPLQGHILHKIRQQARDEHVALALSQQKTGYFVYYQEATNYWIKATCYVPYYRKNGEVMTPSHGRFLYFNDERTAQTVMTLLNSSLFYVWFATYSDGFHLSHTLVKAFPVDKALYALPELAMLAARLHEDIKNHVQISTRNTRPNANRAQQMHQIELEEYHMHHSKPIIDKIDRVLAHHYGFTDEELDFIINYEIKYRLSQKSKNMGTGN